MFVSIFKIILAITLAINALLWSRFYSWGFISPWWNSEIIIPLAPLFAAMTLFIWLIFDESNFHNKVREILDNILINHPIKTLIISIGLTIGTISFTNLTTPPKWTELIDNSLLSGYDDEFSRAINIQNEIASINSEFSLLLKTAIELESKNKEHSNWVTPERFKRLNQLQKTLETIHPSSGYSENLKRYSIALLNDMYLRLDYFKNDKDKISKIIEQSVLAILNDEKIYQTKKMKKVCKRMLANTYYKMDEVQKAIKHWEELEVSPNVYANIHVGYRDLKDFSNAMKASEKGFKLLDSGYKEDSQSEEALVANTMTTLMHMQDLTGAIDLYKQRYISKGKTSDSALLQLYAMLIVLTDDISSAEDLIANGSFLNDENGYVHLLISLKKKQKKEALKIARELVGGEKSKMNPTKVWKIIFNNFEDAGYLGSKELMLLIEWGNENAI